MAAKTGIGPIVATLGIGAGLVYMYQTGKLHSWFQAPQKNEALLKLRLTGFHSNPEGGVYANIEALNPSSVPMQVQSIVGDFFVAHKKAGAVKMFGDQVIRPNDQGMIEVAVRVLPAAAAIFRKRGTLVEFRGEINLNNNVLPLTMKYTL